MSQSRNHPRVQIQIENSFSAAKIKSQSQNGLIAESQKLAAQQLVHIIDLINQTVTVIQNDIYVVYMVW